LWFLFNDISFTEPLLVPEPEVNFLELFWQKLFTGQMPILSRSNQCWSTEG